MRVAITWTLIVYAYTHLDAFGAAVLHYRIEQLIHLSIALKPEHLASVHGRFKLKCWTD